MSAVIDFAALLPLSQRVGQLLRARGETVVVGESSAGGLISAALLAVPGASAYFLGAAVVYTHRARSRLVQISRDDLPAGMRSSSEPYALLLAQRSRALLSATWGLSETGAAGPGNSYGDPSGHSCIAVAGPVERTLTLRTGDEDRVRNMFAFTAKALETLAEVIESTQG